MDTENIASILKDAINASSSTIQSESKRTKVFVLPPELLKGLLGKNETPTNNSTTEPETSKIQNSEKVTKNKRQSLKSPKLPVDRPKRINNRQSKASPNTNISRKSSKTNTRGSKNKEQNDEQSTVTENNETSDTSNAVEKDTIQKKSNRGRKAKTKKDEATLDFCNIEPSPDTLLDTTQEKISDTNHELDNCSIDEISDKPLDNYNKKKCDMEVSDVVEENCTTNTHESQDNSIDDILCSKIQEANSTNLETASLDFEKKSCDKTMKVVDINIENNDQALQDSHTDISQRDSSQKILDEEISSVIELYDQESTNVLSSEPTSSSQKGEIVTIEEETYIVEEIIEYVDEDEIVSTLEESNAQTHEAPKVESSAPSDSQSEPICENLPVECKPIVEQKRSNATRVYVNKRKNKKETSKNEVQECFVRQENENCNKSSLISTTLEASQKLQDKISSEVNCNSNHHSLTNNLKTSQELIANADCNHDKNSRPIEKFIVNEEETLKDSEVDSGFDQDNFVDNIPTTTSTVDLSEELVCSQKIQEKNNLETECISNQDSVIGSALTENPKIEHKDPEQVDSKINSLLDLIISGTKKSEKLEEISCDSGANDFEKSDDENEISDPVEKFPENHVENLKEIQAIDSIEKLCSTDEKSEREVKQTEMKISNTRRQRKSLNAMKDVESTKTSESSELTKVSAHGQVSNHVNSTTASTSYNNKEVVESKNYWENEKNCSIKSLRQLRNRTKVIPQDPENFNKLKNNIEKESLHLKNFDKSDTVLRNNVEISNRTRSASLNLEPNSPEILSRNAKKITRKPQSTDNNLENARRTLRRYSAAPGNETKLAPVLEAKDKMENQESLSSEIVESEKNETDEKNGSQSVVLKDIACVFNSTSMKDVGSIVAQKSGEIITPESNLSEKLNCNVDSQNCNISIEAALSKSNSSRKPEKVIVVKKIMKGRRSKSSQSKDDSGVTTCPERDDNKTVETGNVSKTSDNVGKSGSTRSNLTQVDLNETAKNTEPSGKSLSKKLNCKRDDPLNRQENIALEENAVKIKTEKISPVKNGRKGNEDDSIDTSIINQHAFEESTLNIKIEKMSPDKNVRQSRRSKSISSSFVDSESTNDILDTSVTNQHVDNTLEESPLNIKIEKVSPDKNVRQGRRSKEISSSSVDSESTNNMLNTNKNRHMKIDESVILSNDNVDNAFECNSSITTTTDQQLENALESNPKIKIEKVTPPIRGSRRGRRPMPNLSNIRAKRDKENVLVYCTHDKSDTEPKALEDISHDNSTLANAIVDSNKISENEGKDNLNEKSDCNQTETSGVDEKVDDSSDQKSLKAESRKLPVAKKGKRGRRSQKDASFDNNEIIANDCNTPSENNAGNNADLQKDVVPMLEEITENIKVEESVSTAMDVNSTVEENNAADDSNMDLISNDEKIEEKPTVCKSKLTRRQSRHDKEESSCKDTIVEAKRDCKKRSVTNVEPEEPIERKSLEIAPKKRRGRPSRKEMLKNDSLAEKSFDRCLQDSLQKDKDIDSDAESDLGNTSVRKSGRRRKPKVNYCVPDEDVDVIASEMQKPKKPEDAPKKRRGRPSRKDMLQIDAPVVENLEQNSQETVKKDACVDSAADDCNVLPTDSGDTTTVKSRDTKKSTIDKDTSGAEPEPMEPEDSPDTQDQPAAEPLSDAANDLEDDKSDDESVIEEPKSRRGKKRKYTPTVHTGKRGRPPKRQRKSTDESSNDEEYTPHHSYVDHSPKTKEKTTKEPASKKMVKCGKCEKEMPKCQWYSHNLNSHNDMGWLDGDEKPDYENDQKLLTRILTIAHKKKKKRGFKCEMCSELKKSVVGFMSHIMFCQKTEEEIESLLAVCEQCGGKFKPSSMEYHERTHRLDIKGKENKEQDTIENLDSSEPRSKRKAAEKAVSRISEFTALVKEDDGSSAKKLKISSHQIKKFILKPNSTRRISSFLIAKWRRELENNQDAACTQLGCQFTCKSFDEMREHYSSCKFTVTENYVCKVCRFQTSNEDEIIKHATEKHTAEDLDRNATMSGGEASSSEDYTDVDEDDSSNENQTGVKNLIYKESSDVANKMFRFLFNNGVCKTIFNRPFLLGFKWTLEFERKNYKLNILNDYEPNNFKLLEEDEAADYLPELDVSMPARFSKDNVLSNESEWKKWTRFESSIIDESPTFFVGGPVWAMAWAPTPTYLAHSENLPQYLAISTHPTMDAEYSVGQAYRGKNIIQIWSVGKLNNIDASDSNPKLSYAIAHDGGTVWSLEWCPSGCYQHEDFSKLMNENDSNRLGLLAAGCSDGSVRVYSLIFPNELPHSPSENQYPIYETEPVLKLVVNTKQHDEKSETWQVMRLCWSKESNHNVIVAGFSNGYVGFWNITTKSPMLRYKVNNTTFLRPYKHFFAHHHAVTMVHLVPHDNKRYLATASLDRLYKFWDLEDTSRPRHEYTRSLVTDGAWLNNWFCAVLTYDDALSLGKNPTLLIPLRCYDYKHFNLLPSNSTTFGVSASDYGNSVATGNIAGELLAIFPHNIMYTREIEKTIPSKRNYSLISTTELVDFKAESNQQGNKDKKEKKRQPYSDPSDFMPSTFEESKDRFGIQFNDNIKIFNNHSKTKPKSKGKKTLNCEHLERVPVEQYPLKSINKVAWNPNASSFLWLAAGYQNGFVRLISLRSAAMNVEYDKLLHEHTNILIAQMSKTTENSTS